MPTFWNTGGRYNPSTDSWTATSTTNAPDCSSQSTRQCGPALKWSCGADLSAWQLLTLAGDTIPAPIVGQPPAPPMRPMLGGSHGSLDRQRNDRLGWTDGSDFDFNTGGRYNPEHR